jgi:Arc/MetJ-type ribon-helix-helix transcriptional regulator
MRKSFEFGTGKLRTKIGVIAEGPEGKDLKELLHQFGRGENRSHVVMVRLGDEALARIDQLVDAELFSSRSECAAFLIGAGIQSKQELFERLSAQTEEIRRLKEQMRQTALDALQPKPDASGAGRH